MEEEDFFMWTNPLYWTYMLIIGLGVLGMILWGELKEWRFYFFRMGSVPTERLQVGIHRWKNSSDKPSRYIMWQRKVFQKKADRIIKKRGQ